MKMNIPAEVQREVIATAFKAAPQPGRRAGAFYGKLTLNVGLMDMVNQYIIRSSLDLPCDELAARLIDVIKIGMREYASYPEYCRLLQESVDLMKTQMPISLFQRHDLDNLFRRVQTNPYLADKILRYFKQYNMGMDMEHLHRTYWKNGMSEEYHTSFENLMYWEVIDCSLPCEP